MTAVAPGVPGVVDAAEVVQTSESIVETQWPSGVIPWFGGGDADPWDHIECAMALSAAGKLAEAEHAYTWLRSAQRGDGSWPMRLRPGMRQDATVDGGADTNQCAYVATGVWHHTLVTGDAAFASSMWPTVRRAIDFVVSLQQASGEVAWARNARGRAVRGALLTGCSSIHHSLRCAVALADFLGCPQPNWELAAVRLAGAVAHRPELFEDRRRYSMDWYYPVLGGALRGVAAKRRLDAQWEDFVVPAYGVRCVADRPWVTGAETCELVLALDAIEERDCAEKLFAAMQHLRDGSGAYWTGYVVDDDVRWPIERSTWTSAAVILAADALSGTTGGSGIFRGATGLNGPSRHPGIQPS